MKNIAIIGGHGFIGKNFTDFLLQSDYKITLIGKGTAHNQFSAEVESVEADIQNTSEIIAAVVNSEVVIWLASSLIPGVHQSSLELDFETNIKPVIAFLEKTKELSFSKFIYLSSGGTVYGDTFDQVPLGEDHHKSPISAYGLSKLVTENYIQFLTRNSNFESFILRPSNVYGKYQNLSKPQGIIGFAFKSLIHNSTIDLYDDGKVIRDFVSVTDLAVVTQKCIEKPTKISETHFYNIGSGIPLSIKEVISKISKVAGKEVETVEKSSRNFDCEYNVLSIEKVKNELNWEPKVDMIEGLKEVWDWIKETEND